MSAVKKAAIISQPDDSHNFRKSHTAKLADPAKYTRKRNDSGVSLVLSLHFSSLLMKAALCAGWQLHKKAFLHAFFCALFSMHLHTKKMMQTAPIATIIGILSGSVLSHNDKLLIISSFSLGSTGK